MRRLCLGMVAAAALAGAGGCGGEVKKSDAELKAEQEKAEQQSDSEERAYQKQQRAKQS